MINRSRSTTGPGNARTACASSGAAARLHNELRPIHFINRGGFTSAAIGLQVSTKHYKIVMLWQDKFSKPPTGSRTVGAVFLAFSLRCGREFAAELLR